jgi:hypothetical protein
VTSERPPFRGKPEDYRPARGYSWPPLLPGHANRKTHGAYHAATVDPVATALVESLGDVDYIATVPEFAASVWGWARAEAKVRLVTAWLDEHGVLDEDGKPRPAADLLVRLEKMAAEARSRLGLDPLSRARLGRDVSATGLDLARLWQEQAAGGAEPPQDGDESEERVR